MKPEQVREIIDKLNGAGAVAYPNGSPVSYPAARMGITLDGEVWYQNGQAAHRVGPASSCTEDGCGWTFTRDGQTTLFVLPEDADTWELGALVTALGADRESVTFDELLQTV